MNPVETIIEEQKKNKITLCGRDFYVKKLGIIQECKLIKVLSGSILKQSNELREKFKKGQSYKEDIMALLSMLDENVLPEIIAILLKIDDIELCKQIVEEEDDKILDLVLLIFEYNDIPKLVKKVQRVFEKVANLM